MEARKFNAKTSEGMCCCTDYIFLIVINRICFANFDSTVGYRLAERTAEREVKKQFPNIDFSEAKVNTGCSLRSVYYVFRFREEIQVAFFWEGKDDIICVDLNGYLPLWAKNIRTNFEDVSAK